jgi:hypothetical protein
MSKVIAFPGPRGARADAQRSNEPVDDVASASAADLRAIVERLRRCIAMLNEALNSSTEPARREELVAQLDLLSTALEVVIMNRSLPARGHQPAGGRNR